jgi:hypothetical protein
MFEVPSAWCLVRDQGLQLHFQGHAVQRLPATCLLIDRDVVVDVVEEGKGSAKGAVQSCCAKLNDGDDA